MSGHVRLPNSLLTSRDRTGVGVSISPLWLALLAGPASFGIAGPALVLAEIARGLETSVAATTAVVTAFGWGLAAGTPLMGVLLDRKGVGATLTACGLLAISGASVVLSANGLPGVLVGVAIHGLGAAGMTVAAMNLAGSPVSLGLVTASLAIVGAASPLIGSLVSGLFSWRVTLVLPLLSLVAIPVVLRQTTTQRGGDSRWPPFDLLGASLLVAWVSGLVLVPQRPVVAGAWVLVVTLVLRWHLRRRPTGFLPAALLTAPQFTLSAAVVFALSATNFAILYAASGALAEHTGWTVNQLGVALLAPYLTGGLASIVLVPWSARLGYMWLLAVLTTGAGIALVLMVIGGASTSLLVVAMFSGSVAAATGQGALALRASAASDSRRPTAMGFFSLCFLLGVPLGPAIAALATA